MHTRFAAAAAIMLAISMLPMGRADLPCVFPDLPCPFQMEGGEVGPGETRTVTGPAAVDEPLDIRGTLILQGAQLFVHPALPVFTVHEGGALHIVGSVLDTQDGELGEYVIHVLPGGKLEVATSVLRNGQGIIIESEDAVLRDVHVVGGGARGVEFRGVTGQVTRLTTDAARGVDVTGGDVTVEGSTFLNATQALNFVSARGSVVGNKIVASANGLRARDATIVVEGNQMSDRADPAGRGVSVFGGGLSMSRNVISQWGIGVEAHDARLLAFDNDLASNVGYGLYARNVSAVITDNRVQGNAFGGMLVELAPNVTIDRNVMKDSALFQCVLIASPDASVRNNTFSGGVFYGFAAGDVARIALEDNLATGIVGYGLYVEAAQDALVRRNTVAGVGTGVTVLGHSATVTDNRVSGTVLSGFDLVSYDVEGPFVLERLSSSQGVGSGFRIVGSIQGEDLSADGHRNGFDLDASSTGMTLTRVNASGNTVGVIVRGAGTHAVNDLRAFDNGEDGVRVVSDSTVVLHGAAFGGHDEGHAVNATVPRATNVDARFSWWGHESGPSGEGAGLGDAVTAGVDYAPWLTTRPPG